MNVNTSLLAVLSLFVSAVLISLSFFSFTEANRLAESRAGARTMCTNEMFCYLPIYNQALSSRRAVAVPCNAASAGVEQLHIAEYYFEDSTNRYIAFIGAGIAATSTSESPICLGPRMVESASRPVSMTEVQPPGNAYRQHCTLDGKQIYVSISAEDYAAITGGGPIGPLMIDPNKRANCFYSSIIQNPSPRGR